MSERDIFTAAREMADPVARRAYLDGSCGDDTGLRSRVEALLCAHDHPDSLLDRPAVAPREPESATTRTFDRESGTGSDEVPLGFLAPPTRPDSLGRIGHYEVLQVLGRGGFGTVFRAFDDVLQRVVAVKVMAPQLAATSPARKRFLREARTSAAIRHEHVVQVHEVGETPLPYLVMEFIPGETLQQRLNRVGPVEAAEVVRIGRQIAEGLSAAHAMDLIHRDIKPGNILLEGGHQKVKITDFGLARAADDASISQSGIIAGTPMYMAPEQAKGEKLDQRADLFSLGSVLYQMAAGRPPFRANGTVAVLKRVAEDTPRDIREITPETPQWLCDIIAKLHAKSPDDRYQSAREVADVLADCEAQLKANSKLKDYSRIPCSQPRRSGRQKWVAAAAMAALVVAFAGSWFGRAGMLYFSDRGELELLPQDGLVSVIVLENNEGVLDDNKLHTMATDWLDMKKSHTLNLPPGRYQLNVGTWPAGTHVSQWEVTTSGPLGSSEVNVPVINSSAIVTVERGRRVTLRAKLRTDPQPPAPFADTSLDANEAQEASAKRLGLPVETTNSIGMKLRLLPPGKFKMGSSQEEIDFWLGHTDDELQQLVPPLDVGLVRYLLRCEGPQHEVELTQPFYMGQTEVTVGQFRQFVEEDGYQVGDARWRNPEFDQTDKHPVIWVSWNNAVDFCKWLSAKEGKEYRLPTVAEWEYSCRAGKAGSRYSFGDDDAQLENYAWFNKNARGGTHPVGRKKPNDWGLFDMHGNALEWCQDNWDPDYYKNSPLKDPRATAASGRVACGGAWNCGTLLCRSAFHGYLGPDDRRNGGGFRVLLVSPAALGTASGTKNKPAPAAIAPFTDADVQRIAALPAPEQVEEVRKELKRRNPGFDGKMETKIEGGVVTEFQIVSDKVTDIAPIRVFAALRVLDCRGTWINFKPNGLLADLRPLEEMNLAALTYLNLSNTNVGDAGLANFKHCKNLVSLYLGYTKVSDEGLANFKDCKKLTNLWLDGTQVGDEGMIHFQDCKALTRLSLAGTKVSDVGLAHFKDCKNLESLWLDRTQVGDAGLAQFKGLPLRVLSTDNTRITDLTPLQGMPLEDIRLTPKNITKSLDILHGMTSLKTIGIDWNQSWPAAEFWERYDKGEFK